MRLKLNTPLLLTALRLTISPIVLPLLIYYCVPYDQFILNLSIGLLFLGICLTDFFDGYLARKLNQETLLGKLLDPLADKLFLTSTMISLVAINRLYILWAIILIGREIFIMGMRQMAASFHASIPVSLWGKFKTGLQCALLFWLIINPYHGMDVQSGQLWNSIEALLLAFSIALSVYSAYLYIRSSSYLFQRDF